MKRKGLRVALCLPGGVFQMGATAALARTVGWLERSPHTYELFFYTASNIPRVRNRLVLTEHQEPTKDAVPFNGWEYDVAVWIDSDVSWSVEGFQLLLEDFEASGRQIITGLYLLQSGRYSACWDIGGRKAYPMAQWMQSTREAIEKGERDPLVEMESAGLGFCAVPYGVLEALGYPWFRLDIQDDQHARELLGEDTVFFADTQLLGWRLYADPRIRLSHWKTMQLRG